MSERRRSILDVLAWAEESQATDILNALDAVVKMARLVMATKSWRRKEKGSMRNLKEAIDAIETQGQ